MKTWVSRDYVCFILLKLLPSSKHFNVVDINLIQKGRGLFFCIPEKCALSVEITGPQAHFS